MTYHWLLQAKGSTDKTLPQAIELGSELDTSSYVIGAVVLLVGVFFVWRMVKLSRINGWKYSGAAVGNEEIFNRLCEANKLTRAEGFLMRKLVYDQRMENPLLPFVDPGVIDRYAARLNRNKQAMFGAIKERIFG